MIRLNIKLSEENIKYIKDAINRKSLLRRVKDITGLNAKTLYDHIDKNYNGNDLIRCGFCGSLRKFDYFDYDIINGELYIVNYRYNKKINICSRSDNHITKNCKSKLLNPNSIEFVRTAYGFETNEEANEFILKRNKSPFYRTNYNSDEEYRKAQKRDLEFYGEAKYNEVRKKISYASKKSILIEKYGKEKAEEICKRKDSSSKEHFKNKYGVNWEEYYNKKIEKTRASLENYIKRYGKELGTIKYNEYIEKKVKRRYEFLSKLTKEEKSKLFGTTSKEYFKNKYGDDWEKYYKNRQKKIQVKAQRASKESLKFFNKLIPTIEKYNLKYYIGIPGNNEWFIYDSKEKKINFYDFCIKDLKIIIEFHGSMWHYNPNFNYDRKLPFKTTLEEIKKNDAYKKDLALKNGFKYFEIFDTDDYNKKANELLEIIKEEIAKNDQRDE